MWFTLRKNPCLFGKRVLPVGTRYPNVEAGVGIMAEGVQVLFLQGSLQCLFAITNGKKASRNINRVCGHTGQQF